MTALTRSQICTCVYIALLTVAYITKSCCIVSKALIDAAEIAQAWEQVPDGGSYVEELQKATWKGNCLNELKFVNYIFHQQISQLAFNIPLYLCSRSRSYSKSDLVDRVEVKRNQNHERKEIDLPNSRDQKKIIQFQVWFNASLVLLLFYIKSLKAGS